MSQIILVKKVVKESAQLAHQTIFIFLKFICKNIDFIAQTKPLMLNKKMLSLSHTAKTCSIYNKFHSDLHSTFSRIIKQYQLRYFEITDLKIM